MKKKIGNFFDIRLFGYFYLYAMTPSSILDHPLKSIFSMFQMIWSKKIYIFFQKMSGNCPAGLETSRNCSAGVGSSRRCSAGLETSINCPAGLGTSRNCPAGLGHQVKRTCGRFYYYYNFLLEVRASR